MHKRIRFKSLLLDFFVVLLCLSVAAFFAYLFWQDLNTFTVRKDKDEIGIISFRHNVAQRKFDDRVVWERITTGTKLYFGDTVRTADLSEAILTLKDGSVIDLSENTMIKVGTNASGDLQIFIDGGDIQIDSTTAESSLEVKLDDGSLVNVEAGSALTAKSDALTGVRNVEVKSGNAQITTENGQTASLSHGESVNVEKGREIKKNPVTVIYPPVNLKLLKISRESLPVRFEWKTSSDEPVILELSSTRDFSQIISSQKYSDTSADLRFQTGQVWWRLYTSSTKDKAVLGKLSLETIPQIQGISPATETSFQYINELPRIFFRWNGNEYAQRYRFLLSSSPDMRSIVQDSEVSENYANFTLPEGNYWWQITPFYAESNLGYAGESPVYSFKVKKNLEIRRPELSSPADNAQLVYRDKIQASFIWKSDLKEASYQLSIAKDYDFNNVVFSQETEDTRLFREFSPAELKDGNYYWKIARKSSGKEDRQPVSEIRTFRVARYLPQDNKLLYPPENFSVEGGKVSGTAFMWKLSDEYEKSSAPSVLQISANPAFTQIQMEKDTGESVLDNFYLPAGNYWWRVGVRKSDGSLTGITESRKFTVLAELDPPLFISPEENQEITVYNYSPVLFKWNEVKDAVSYNLKIMDYDGKTVKSIEGIKEKIVQVTLDGGSYTCSVQALATSTRISPASERKFSVRSPSKIFAQSPGADLTIPALTALRSPTIFIWQPGKDRPSNYRFILSKFQRDGSLKPIESIDTKKNTLSLTRLKEGRYSWKIIASTSNGIPLDSNIQTFSVGRVPLLPAPLLQSPRNDFVMTGDYLKKNRSIDFIWQDVEGATSYTFSLYKKESSGRKKLIYTEKNTRANSVRIDNLSILDIGKFEWSVSAFSYAKDGYLEQKGITASSSFTINFASPTKVETVNPGKLYGN
ncbi:MAG: FecR family protein [Treponema sp.]|nr:FecR family protein [Treponema sp.]